MGESVGVFVGFQVGIAAGIIVGIAEGVSVGNSEGVQVVGTGDAAFASGKAVGINDGNIDGNQMVVGESEEGKTDGTALDSSEGIVVGRSEGIHVSMFEGDNEGAVVTTSPELSLGRRVQSLLGVNGVKVGI